MRAGIAALALLALSLAGCGASSSPPPATSAAPTAVSGYTDPAVGVSARAGRVLPGPTTMYLLVTLTNTSRRDYQADASPQFVDSALAEPTTRGTIGACDADTSHGAALQYNAVPARQTHHGWIRCDYPHYSHVVAVFWHSHEIGAYRVPA